MAPNAEESIDRDAEENALHGATHKVRAYRTRDPIRRKPAPRPRARSEPSLGCASRRAPCAEPSHASVASRRMPSRHRCPPPRAAANDGEAGEKYQRKPIVGQHLIMHLIHGPRRAKAACGSTRVHGRRDALDHGRRIFRSPDANTRDRSTPLARRACRSQDCLRANPRLFTVWNTPTIRHSTGGPRFAELGITCSITTRC